MSIVIPENDEHLRNVIYLITMVSYGRCYHYIGLTKQELRERMKQHLADKKSAVRQFMQENNVTRACVQVVKRSELKGIDLDFLETREISDYFCKRGTKNNQKNRLVNKDLKGVDNFTLKELKEVAKLQIA